MAGTAPSGTITLMFTDIEDSTGLWERMGDRFRPVLDRHNQVVRERIARWQAYEVKSQGDSFMVAFKRGTDAVQCALEIQRVLAQEEWPVEVGELRVRIGIHVGEPFLGCDPAGRVDYFGPMVNRAARVADAGHGGQILLSAATRDLLQGTLPGDLELIDHGSHRLRGLGQAEHLFEARHPDLPSRSFPPLRTLDPRRTNLPMQGTPFVGRELELRELQELLSRAQTRLVTLLGFGGIGKTRTALQLAELCADEFADGVWWVELEEVRTGQEMIQRIASRLCLPLRPEPTVKEQLWSFLQERQLLLLLDNTEQIPDAADPIRELLNAARRVKCIVTTRRALELQAEQVMEIRPLSEADAERLFIERARARQADFTRTADNAGDIAALCRRLEGVPLALELAASRILGMSPREIHRHLAERFRVLQTRAPDLPPRQRALRGVMDWSYELLSEDDRSLLAYLAVFAGGFTLAHAEAVCDGCDVFEGVMELRRHSLLRAETDAVTQETRFLMLESVREYAAEKLRELGDAGLSVRQRHARQFQRFAREQISQLRTPREATALQQFEAEFENVRAALDGARESAWPDGCAEIALALGIYLQRRGFQREALQSIQTGLDAARQSPSEPTRLHGELLRERAGLHIDRFEWAEAHRWASEALALFESLNDPRGTADACNLRGLAAKGEENFTEARRCFATALEQFQRLNDTAGIAQARSNLGLVEYQDEGGSRDEASRQWQETLRLHRESGDQRGIAEVLTNLGALAQEQGNLDQAWRDYEEALQIERELRHALGVGRALSNLGEVAELRGEICRAFRLFTGAEALFDQLGSPYQPYTAHLLCRVASQLTDTERTVAEPPRTLESQSLDELVHWALTAKDQR